MRCLLLLAALLIPFSADALTIDWVTVGDPGNADDTHGDGYGGVDYVYRISKHEVTNAQYAEFLNAVDRDGTNPNGIYNTSMGTIFSEASTSPPATPQVRNTRSRQGVARCR